MLSLELDVAVGEILSSLAETIPFVHVVFDSFLVHILFVVSGLGEKVQVLIVVLRKDGSLEFDVEVENLVVVTCNTFIWLE